MKKNELIGTGRILSLAIDGKPMKQIRFDFTGPIGDSHSGLTRTLDGHDAPYTKTSRLRKGDEVFNWRSWTAVSAEEVKKIEWELSDLSIPAGCLLENLVVSGINNLSQLPPTSRFVFPTKANGSQLILAVWGENSPCNFVGQRLQEHHKERKDVSRDFISSAVGKRGVMGFVLSPGFADVGDLIQVYSPV